MPTYFTDKPSVDQVSLSSLSLSLILYVYTISLTMNDYYCHVCSRMPLIISFPSSLSLFLENLKLTSIYLNSLIRKRIYATRRRKIKTQKPKAPFASDLVIYITLGFYPIKYTNPHRFIIPKELSFWLNMRTATVLEHIYRCTLLHSYKD